MSHSLSALLVWLAAAAAAAGQPTVTVLSGATIIDGTGKTPLAAGVVVISGAQIDCVGAAADCPVPDGARVIELEGRWIMPGLVDSHVHFSQTGWADGRPDAFDLRDVYPYEHVVAALRAHPERWYRSYLCSGITAVYDVGGYPWSWGLREDDRNPQAIHVAAAGPLVTHAPPAPLMLPAEQQFIALTDPEAGRAAVRYLAAFGADAVKLWFLAPAESEREAIDARVAAVGEQSRASGIALIAHATELREAKVALAAGARLLVHSVWDQPVDEEFLALAREAGAAYTPTLQVMEGYDRLYRSIAFARAPAIDDPNGCLDPETRRKAGSGAQYAERTKTERFSAERFAERRTWLNERSEIMAENLRRVHAAGIPIAAGTDAGNPFTFHGPAIYAELEAMQAAGLGPADVLLSATRNGARVMGRADELGTVEAGKRADLLVLGADPLSDIANLRELRIVVREGVVLPIESLAW